MKKIYCQSQFTQHNINSLREFISEYGEESICVVFDTNIVIYLRDIYLNATDSINRLNDIWPALEEFLFLIKYYGLECNYYFGLDESCRNKNDFSFNKQKVIQTIDAVSKILDFTREELVDHIESNIIIEPFKDLSGLGEGKLNYFDADTSFNSLQVINYPALLKAYLLKNNSGLTQFERAMNMLNYIDKVLDVSSLDLLKFTYMYFGDNPKVKSMLHPKNKSKDKLLQGIWNCAIDLSIYLLSNGSVTYSKLIPVFATFDEGLYEFNKNNKIIAFFTTDSKGEFVVPPIIEMSLEAETKWTEEENKELIKVIDKIGKKHLDINRKFDSTKIKERMMKEIVRLESEL